MYIPGDWWMICERTGFKCRRSEMRKEWTGAWVHKSVYNERHPQDFVKAIPDDPSVDVSRPDVAPAMGETTLNGAITKDAATATLTDASGLVENDIIGIVMDNSVTHWTFLTADEASSVVALHVGMPYAAASGNVVYLPSRNNEEWQ